MATFLVTGGAGFIGAEIVRQLCDLGHEVRCLDLLLPTAHPDGPPDLDPRADVRIADVRDLAAVRAACDGVDGVAHEAGMVGLGVDFADAPDYVSHNALGAAVLLRALHDRGFAGRLVLASSMVVYGEGRYRCPRDGVVRPVRRLAVDLDAGRYEPRCPACRGDLVPEPIGEDTPPDPRSVYAATKLHQEHLCQAFAAEHEAALTVLRYHNVYGPGMPPDTPYAGVAAIFRSAIAAGRAPLVLEDGLQQRDFVHVHDVARANVLALTGPHATPGTFNVASGEPRTVGDLARALWEATGGTTPPPRVVGGARPGNVRHVFASPARAHVTLGFAAQVPFADGMAGFATAPLRRPAAHR